MAATVADARPLCGDFGVVLNDVVVSKQKLKHDEGMREKIDAAGWALWWATRLMLPHQRTVVVKLYERYDMFICRDQHIYHRRFNALRRQTTGFHFVPIASRVMCVASTPGNERIAAHCG